MSRIRLSAALALACSAGTAANDDVDAHFSADTRAASISGCTDRSDWPDPTVYRTVLLARWKWLCNDL